MKKIPLQFQEQRVSTKDNVERRLARTAEELAEEESDDDIDVVEENVDSDDSDSVPYNPKNLPLGWDGKVCRCVVRYVV